MAQLNFGRICSTPQQPSMGCVWFLPLTQFFLDSTFGDSNKPVPWHPQVPPRRRQRPKVHCRHESFPAPLPPMTKSQATHNSGPPKSHKVHFPYQKTTQRHLHIAFEKPHRGHLWGQKMPHSVEKYAKGQDPTRRFWPDSSTIHCYHPQCETASANRGVAASTRRRRAASPTRFYGAPTMTHAKKRRANWPYPRNFLGHR